MPNTFTLTIELGDDAMQNNFDVSEALRETAEHVELSAHPDLYRDSGIIKDVNGNTVGRWEFA